MTNYREIAQDIMLRVGGPENINNINHCATRLRLTLADAGRVDERELKAVRGVMGIVARNNNLQIIVGTEVPGIYAEFVKLNEGEGVKADTKQSDSVGEKTEVKKGCKALFWQICGLYRRCFCSGTTSADCRRSDWSHLNGLYKLFRPGNRVGNLCNPFGSKQCCILFSSCICRL